MIIYVYSKCSSCQKALKFLKEKNIQFIQRQLPIERPTIEELELMLKHQNGDLKRLFNTSGQLYKEMELSLKLKNTPLEEALKLLNTHGMLIKRPFLISDSLGLTGFNTENWAKIFD